MCGIAGLIDLSGDRRPVPPGVLAAMAEALTHRGPDEDGFLEQAGVGLASRRLSIVGLADGRQPLSDEGRTAHVVFNGEIFDYPELRADLEARGHRFATHCDTEVIPHLWQEYREGLFDHLRGQFAFALWDERLRRLVLARDRFGICPLYWTRQAAPGGDWLLFASEIKALLASGLVAARPDLRGIDQVFTFFALPGPVTCFDGVQALLPGHCLTVQLSPHAEPAEVRDRTYWELDFPDRGEEVWGRDEQTLADELESLLLRAVERRLRADVPVVAYLSGGIDSTLVVRLASYVRGEPLPTFTIQVRDPRLDESGRALEAARHVGSRPVILSCGPREVLEAYPRLIRAAECPVSDTCSAALLLLAREVHGHGYKVTLTGEGSDESLAGYPWYKAHRLLALLDVVPGLPLGRLARRAFLSLSAPPRLSWRYVCRAQRAVGGHNAWLDLYGVTGLARLHFYGAQLRCLADDYVPYADLGLNLDRLRRWHPMHQSLYLGFRIHLAGLLLSTAGDRVAMHSSVETRYPFLDEDVVAFLARLHPSWKLRGLRDKYLLRRLAERWLPRPMAWRPKAMFQTPYDVFASRSAPAYVGQLLSPKSLRRAGYFDVAAVQRWRRTYRQLRTGSALRVSVEMGLAAVLGTQLWHHTFLDGTLAELPAFERPTRLDQRAPRVVPQNC